MGRKERATIAALWACLALLLLGTQMPGEWRDAAFRLTGWPVGLTDVAHFALFAALACLLRLPPLAQPALRVLLAALALALATEGLQHFAAHREPSWADVGVDMAGATLGLALGWLLVGWNARRAARQKALDRQADN